MRLMPLQIPMFFYLIRFYVRYVRFFLSYLLKVQKPSNATLSVKDCVQFMWSEKEKNLPFVSSHDILCRLFYRFELWRESVCTAQCQGFRFILGLSLPRHASMVSCTSIKWPSRRRQPTTIIAVTRKPSNMWYISSYKYNNMLSYACYK